MESAAPESAPTAEASAEVGVDAPADSGADAMSDSAQEPVVEAGASCPVDPPTPADGPRTVLVTHPFPASGSASSCGRRVRVLRLDAQGKLADIGKSLDVGDCPLRVRFSPHGRLALVAVSNTHEPANTQRIVVLRNDAAGNVNLAGELSEFAGTNPTEVKFSSDGTRAYVTDYDVSDGALHVMDVEPGCGAKYRKKIPMQVPQNLALLPGDKYAFVMGDKAPADAAIVNLESESVIAHHDLFPDFVYAYSLALSTDGKQLAIPNSSPFSSLAQAVATVRFDAVSGVPVPKVVGSAGGLVEPTGVQWLADGSKLLVTTFSGNSVAWLEAGSTGDLSPGGKVTGIDLAGYTSMLTRGPNAGLVLVTSVTSIFVLRFSSAGVTKVAELSLGSGNDAIANDVAIEP